MAAGGFFRFFSVGSVAEGAGAVGAVEDLAAVEEGAEGLAEAAPERRRRSVGKLVR
jgi:hypothetical protein